MHDLVARAYFLAIYHVLGALLVRQWSLAKNGRRTRPPLEWSPESGLPRHFKLRVIKSMADYGILPPSSMTRVRQGFQIARHMVRLATLACQRKSRGASTQTYKGTSHECC